MDLQRVLRSDYHEHEKQREEEEERGRGERNEERNEKEELLLFSVLSSDEDTLIRLLNRGTDPDLSNKAGFGLLQLARSDGVVRLLLDYGASPNMLYECGYTALTYHIKYSLEDRDILDLITERSDINIADKNGFTPLHHAIMKGNVSLVRTLLEHGADPALTNEHSGESPLHQAVRRGSRQIVEILLSQRVPVSPLKKTGETPLHLAAWSRDLTCAFLLMRSGANVGARSKSGSTALHWAAERGDKDMIILLLVGGADPLQRDHFGLSSVMVADKRCGEEVSSLFDKYTKHPVPTLLYLARTAYLWKGPITALTLNHVTINDQSEASIEHLPLPIREYLKATDYQLMRENMM